MKKKKYDIGSTDHFRAFANNLEGVIAKYGETAPGEFTARQKEQVEKLVGLEVAFREALINHRWGPTVYKDFVRYIRDTRRSILAARPYFRERQGVFTSGIAKALKARDAEALYPFHFNYEFILWVMKAKNWEGSRIGTPIVKLAEQIRLQRWELVEMNIPLAISRARIFWSRTPAGHLSYMDLVQITSLGLMAAVDKFCLPYTTAFRAVIIGRCVGNLIEQFSETPLHFYPMDKRKLYRANKVMHKFGPNPDYEAITEIVNKDAELNQMTTPAEIADLLAAASTVSADSLVSPEVSDGEAETTAVEMFKADESTQPDVRVEEYEAMAVVSKSLAQLTMLEQKLMRLKGVSL